MRKVTFADEVDKREFKERRFVAKLEDVRVMFEALAEFMASSFVDSVDKIVSSGRTRGGVVDRETRNRRLAKLLRSKRLLVDDDKFDMIEFLDGLYDLSKGKDATIGSLIRILLSDKYYLPFGESTVPALIAIGLPHFRYTCRTPCTFDAKYAHSCNLLAHSMYVTRSNNRIDSVLLRLMATKRTAAETRDFTCKLDRAMIAATGGRCKIVPDCHTDVTSL